jgi:hypothetical protein
VSLLLAGKVTPGLVSSLAQPRFLASLLVIQEPMT